MVKNLKALRLERGVSQQQLADAIFVTQPSIHKYETQNIEPEIAILIRMADYFGTSIDYLVGRTDIPASDGSVHPLFLTEEESSLLACYRSLRLDEKACIRQTANTFLKRK